MKLKTWLDAERGRCTALAGHLGVSVGRISQMADEGVPVKHMQAVRAFTENSVTLEEMVEARTPENAATEPVRHANRRDNEEGGGVHDTTVVADAFDVHHHEGVPQ